MDWSQEKQNRRNRERHAAFKIWMQGVTADLTCSCGVPMQLWHHAGPKRFNIADGGEYSAASIAEELKKCVPMCRACHIKLHDPHKWGYPEL